jgi:hypothetical protein
MLQTLRGHYSDAITSLSHLALLGIAAQNNDRRVWMICLMLIGGISLFAWMSNYKRCRAISDTPTSRITSAAQGYVELYGDAVLADGNLLLSPYSQTSCIWYRYRLYEKEDNKWQKIESGTSDRLIELSDGTGKCLIDPDHAEVIAPEKRVSRQGSYRHEEEFLRRDPLYALGEFSTIGGANSVLDKNADVAELLAAWKENKGVLLQRFDLDGNGEIDVQEWELARRAATREIEKQHREIRAEESTHVMRAPKNERPFILSNLSPQQLRNTYLIWGMVHLSIFLLAIVAVIWFWQGHQLRELFN